MTTPSDAVTQLSEADWIEAARYDKVVTGMRSSQVAALVVIGLLCGLMFPYVPAWQLALWGLASVLALGLRHDFGKRFTKLGELQSIDAQLNFARSRTWIWGLYGAVWTSCAFLLLEPMPPQLEGVCWMLLAGACSVAVLWMSAHLGVARLFLLSAAVCLVASLGLHSLIGWHAVHSESTFWFAGFLLAYLLVLLRVAAKQHEMHAKSIDLSYHNARLIYSLRQQTRTAQEALIFKDRFLAGAAHDLKQPVNALSIYAEWLGKEPELSTELGPKILQAAQAVNTLFDSMFDLVKLDAGQFRVVVQPVDLRRLFSDLELQFRPLAAQKGLELRVRPPPAGAALNSDPAILQRILGNLLGNAIRYTRQGGVLLAVRCEPEALRFEVWDTGIGIPPDQQSRIFGEFYKVQSAGTEEGFGLGLAIVQRLSGLLGHGVSMRSRPGRGSVFCVRAPFSVALTEEIRR
ncbi:sensor histidine kinase [Ottowia sp. VDI28]|uniref:sensor histidine kinase n=1 Tax=Ottowia sp. VDI28 TaxID=3133968 RepID=UPI003C2B3739